MAKKQIKKGFEKYLGFIICVVGLLATLCILLPALGIGEEDSKTFYEGYKVVFGYKQPDSILSALLKFDVNFSFLGLLAFLFPIAAGVVSGFVKSKQKLVKLVPVVLFLTATVLLFLAPTFTKVTGTVLSSSSSVYVPEWSMAYGLIISAILCIIGTLLSGYDFYKEIK